ncbi:hypothetical protein ACWDO7_22730 [Streptomyces sp. NPDC003656]
MINVPDGRETLREIAARHECSYSTLRNKWSHEPGWPDPVGNRGRAKLYDPADVDAYMSKRHRSAAALEPELLYTAKELEAAGIGVKAGTIRADQALGRWPAPDDDSGRAHRWRGATATAALEARRIYRKAGKAGQPKDGQEGEDAGGGGEG